MNPAFHDHEVAQFFSEFDRLAPGQQDAVRGMIRAGMCVSLPYPARRGL